MTQMTSRDLAKLETRRRLGDAALTLFAERGFDEVTVDDIVQRAGVSRRTFFHHFPTKVAAAFPDEAETAVELGQRLKSLPTGVEPMDHLKLIATELYAERLVDIPHMRDRYQMLATVEELRTEDLRTDFLYEQEVVAWLLEMSDGEAQMEVRARTIAGIALAVSRACFYTYAHDDRFDPVEAFKRGLERRLPERWQTESL